MQQLTSLIRICSISLLLSIGYVINLKCILESIINNQLQFELWSITYIASSTYLFTLCLLMILITLCGIKITLLSTHMRKFALSLLFFIGTCGYIASILLAVLFPNSNTSSNYISWQYEILYSLLPLYVSILILFFNNERFSQIINLILFSLILFIPPATDLTLTILQNQNHIMTVIESQSVWKTSSYLSICIATSLLILSHIICMFKHYNSGLFLKFIIISLLIYSITTLIVNEIDFDIYPSSCQYKIYYYYILCCGLYIIYSCEIFIPGPKQKLQIDITDDIMKRPSFNIDIERQQTLLLMQIAEQNNIKGILQRFINNNKKDVSFSMELAEDSMSEEDSIQMPRVISHYNPNENINSVIKIFPDFKPTKEHKDQYFSELIIGAKYLNDNVQRRDSKNKLDRLTDSIAAIVPFYNEKASEIHATLRALYNSFEFIKQKDSKYKFTHFNVLLVGDGWFKADISTKRYLTKLYNIQFDDQNEMNNFNNFKQENHKHNTVILQTKSNKKLCINPFKNGDKKLYLKVTTILKIDNRKKANSHEWFLGKYGFAEWCKCDYMFFTDAYSTCSPESLYRMIQHMNHPKNQDVVCCTGRARVYTIEQELDFQNMLRETHDDNNNNIEETKYDDDNNAEEEINYKWWETDIFKKENEIKVDLLYDKSAEDDDVFYKIQDTEFDHRLTTNAHLRDCQMFEFEALYGTIGCYLLGGSLPVIFYRSKYLLEDEVRGWYFEKINQTNDPENMDLVLGNMKLAEDRILTVTSILNYHSPLRHSLIPECIFYFDPMQSLEQLMKQRRRWINGSIATVIFILRKISFQKWNVNIFRRYYVLSMWYIQLLMYLVVSLSPPLMFIISFKYGLVTILSLIVQGDVEKENKIQIITSIFVAISWFIYLIFIYFMQRGEDFKYKFIQIKKQSIVTITLVWSFLFGILIISGTILQIFQVVFFQHLIEKEVDIVTKWFNYIVITFTIIFLLQSYVLAPLVTKDIKTLTILLNTSVNYLLYAPFYVSFFFINAISNIHDLSWGTRPDNENEEDKINNPKRTTIKILLIVIFMNIILALSVSTLSSYVWSHIIFFGILAFPSLYMIFFSVVWLFKTRLHDLWTACKPKKMKDDIQYVGI